MKLTAQSEREPLEPIYTKRHRRDNASMTLIEKNGVTPKWVSTSFWSNSVVSIDFNESCITVLMLTSGVNGPLNVERHEVVGNGANTVSLSSHFHYIILLLLLTFFKSCSYYKPDTLNVLMNGVGRSMVSMVTRCHGYCGCYATNCTLFFIRHFSLQPSMQHLMYFSSLHQSVFILRQLSGYF